MRSLEQETNPEVLKLMALWLQGELVKTRKDLALARAQKELEKQTAFALNDQLLIFRKIIFSKSSERRAEASDRKRGVEEDQLLLHSQILVPPPKEKQVKKLLEQEAYFELLEAELKEESELRELASPSSEQWEKVEKFCEESRELHVLERRYVVIVNKRQKYKLKKEFNDTDKEVIITAPGPQKLMPGCQYSIDFAVEVVADKYISHTPLERQVREMASLGLYSMNTKTLYNLAQAVSVRLEDVAERIKNEILKAQLSVNADETPWPIQIKDQDDGYMWVISNMAGSYFAFEPSRSGLIIKSLLQGYQGTVMCDGYVGYNRLKKEVPGVRLAHCWAHARRNFIRIEENYPTETAEILDLIDELFKVEREAKSFEDLKILRDKISRGFIAKIKVWCETAWPSARPESKLKQAVEYITKYWSGLTLFLDDVTIALTNNEAERAIRHAVMGRKNSYGSRTHNGADVSATLYTIIESCKKVLLDPRTYIAMAVKMSADGKSPPTPLEYARQSRQP
jgi:transposase